MTFALPLRATGPRAAAFMALAGLALLAAGCKEPRGSLGGGGAGGLAGGAGGRDAGADRGPAGTGGGTSPSLGTGGSGGEAAGGAGGDPAGGAGGATPGDGPVTPDDGAIAPGPGCKPGEAFCNQLCVPSSVNACGPGCAVCPRGENGSPSCDGQRCELLCHTGFRRCGEQCLRDVGPDPCGSGPGPGTPDAAVGCTADQKPCGGGCIAMAACCAAGKEGCPTCQYCDVGTCKANADGSFCGAEKACRTGACVSCRTTGSCSTNPCTNGTFSCENAVETCRETPKANATGCGGTSQCWAGKCTAACPVGQLRCTLDGDPKDCRPSLWTFESGTPEGVVGNLEAPVRVITTQAHGGTRSLATLATPQNAGGFSIALCPNGQWTPTQSKTVTVWLYIDSAQPLLGFSRTYFGALGRDAMSTHGISNSELAHPPVRQWFMMTTNFRQYGEGDGLVVSLTVDLPNNVDIYMDDLRIE